MEHTAQILRSLGRIEGKLEALERQGALHVDRMNRIDADIERLSDKVETEIGTIRKRVGTLEKKQYGIYVIAAFVGVLASLFSKFIPH